MKTFQDGDPVFGVMMNAIANLWPNGTAVLSGCTQTGSGAARQVTVAAGSVVINGTVRSVSQQTKTLDAAAFDRYDMISVNTSGTVVVTKGTEERRVPALPANSVPIAICLIETGQTALPADRIYDSRMDALRLSVLNIDADKDWQGQDIVNIGALQNQTGNIGARTGFVDVPGDVVRKTFSPNVTLNYNDPPATLATFTVPANYSADHDSNFRIGVWRTTSYFTFSTSITVYRNGAQIGSLDIGYIQSAGNIDTTGGCKAGDVITVEGKYNGDERFSPVVQTVEVKSARRADIPAYKVFAETGAW